MNVILEQKTPPSRSLRRSFLSSLGGLVLATGLQAQTSYLISEPQINACIGALLDTGGEGGAGYSDNEDFVTTICSDIPGQAISLSFIIFNLSAEGTAPGDQLLIYDGPDMSAPLIGTYVAGVSPGNVSASFTNTSGCLTLHWTSNETGMGVFAAAILCETPCDPPIAVASMSEASPALICQGESVSFDASPSFAGFGHSLVQYSWNFDDGSIDSTSGPTTSHVFEEPGEYVVQIVLTDEIGCTNDNLIDLVVLVSTTPEFNFNDVTQYCFGQPVDLSVQSIPTVWNELPESQLGDGLFLPDNVGEMFTTDLCYTMFEPGAILLNSSLLEGFCMNFEHSYMGDFVIQLTCPNGQSVVVHEQGGAGTYLGEPVDDDSQANVQGVCYNYCWSPDATNGTWVENSGNGTLPAGTYESVYSMDALVGCPLNGCWTLSFTDLFGSDNGFICDWGLNFDPALYPDLSQFTPVLGVTSSDSTFWSGDGFVVDPTNPQAGTATPQTTGPSTYSVSVTDNFGCTYSDDVTITVIPGPTSAWTVEPLSPQPVGSTINFTDASTSNGEPVTNWEWYVAGDLISNSQTASQTFETPGSFEIMLVTETSNGCVDTLRLFYEIFPDDISIPNVFSPNGDGQNDFLEFKNAQFLRENKLRVYDRWGNEIFTSDNYVNGWNAAGVSEGTYYYTLGLKDGRNFAGHVTLLR